MKYFIDTEFIEYPCTIDLISIAIVVEDGRELYIEISDFDESKASDWVKENVIKKLWSRQKNKSEFNAWSQNGGAGGLMTKSEAASEIRRFIGDDVPEFWGYFADYDWVVFCWLQGTMMDLPKNWPMFCMDIKQWINQGGFNMEYLKPKQYDLHNALDDARWTRDYYKNIAEEDLARALVDMARS